MLTADLDIARVLDGEVLSKEGTAVFKSYVAMLAAIDTIPGTKDTLTHEVFEMAENSLRELGQNELANAVNVASGRTVLLASVAVSAFAANLIAAEMKVAGRGLADLIGVLTALQRNPQ